LGGSIEAVRILREDDDENDDDRSKEDEHYEDRKIAGTALPLTDAGPPPLPVNEQGARRLGEAWRFPTIEGRHY
jgi:hypothetical protein